MTARPVLKGAPPKGRRPAERRVEERGVRRFHVGYLLGEQGLLIVILIFGLVLTLLTDAFLTLGNLRNLVLQSTILGVAAVGLTFVILTAGIDLSVGGTPALSSVVATALSVNYGLPWWVGLLAGVGVGVAVGVINGVTVTRIGITPLIVTLATLSATVGAAFAYTDGANITPVPDFYQTLRLARFLGLPVLIYLFIAVAVVGHILLKHTTFGRAIYAVGGNREAATLSGIATNRTIVTAYVLSGIGASLAGLMLTARLASGSPRAGLGTELTVIAAVVIGGTSLFGGRGSIKGTVLGVLLISMVTNAINLLGIPSAWDRLLLGGVIFVAATIDVYRNRYTQRLMAREAARREEQEVKPGGQGGGASPGAT